MKKIKLTQNKYALVDDEDYEYLNQWKWSIHKKKNTFYVIRNIPTKMKKVRKFALIHRLIMNPPDDKVIDHKDGDGLNNQKSNLRICTQSQNNGNSKIRKDNTSGIKGVSWHKAGKKWGASISKSKKRIFLGLFSNIDDAKNVYEKEAKEYFGKFYREK
jgi:hypothetical protein